MSEERGKYGTARRPGRRVAGVAMVGFWIDLPEAAEDGTAERLTHELVESLSTRVLAKSAGIESFVVFPGGTSDAELEQAVRELAGNP